MSLLDNVACVTYTTSKYADVWPIHFGQLTKHLGGLKSYVFSDKGSSSKFDFKEHQLIEHEDSDPYWKQWIDGLKHVDEQYIIYLQDDFFLYDDVKHEFIAKYRDFLANNDYSYVRLIRCGYETPLDRHICDNIFEVHMNTADAFSQQATLWKKNDFIKLYDHVKSIKWLEGEHWNVGCRELGIKGTFCWLGEAKRGAFHYDSKVFPYVCTAINRGQWNCDQYPETMARLLKEYNIDVTKRGVRRR
jgi:hypothetical protein